jgi:hypothetical protein
MEKERGKDKKDFFCNKDVIGVIIFVESYALVFAPKTLIFIH